MTMTVQQQARDALMELLAENGCPFQGAAADAVIANVDLVMRAADVRTTGTWGDFVKNHLGPMPFHVRLEAWQAAKRVVDDYRRGAPHA